MVRDRSYRSSSSSSLDEDVNGKKKAVAVQAKKTTSKERPSTTKQRTRIDTVDNRRRTSKEDDISIAVQAKKNMNEAGRGNMNELFVPTWPVQLIGRQVRDFSRNVHAQQGGLESYYDSVHHQHQFDHFSIYVRLSFLESEAGIATETRSAVESSEGSIPTRLRAIEAVMSGDPATRTTLNPPLERLNYLETTVVGFTAAHVTRLRPAGPRN